MLNFFGSIASIIGLIISMMIYLKVKENRRFYLAKRYSEISKKRIIDILSIADDKKRCTSSVKNEISSILNLYAKTSLPFFRKRRERQVVKEIERLVQQNGNTLPAIKQNLKLLLADVESEDI